MFNLLVPFPKYDLGTTLMTDRFSGQITQRFYMDNSWFYTINEHNHINSLFVQSESQITEWLQ